MNDKSIVSTKISHFYIDSQKEGITFINKEDIETERFIRADIGYQLNDKGLRAIGYVPIDEIRKTKEK